jgi:hypothetical protein
LTEGAVGSQLRVAASSLGISWNELTDWLVTDANRVLFMQSVGSLAVNFKLRFARDRNAEHRTDRNDLKDLMFLSSVIPHADIVVTEKSWGSIANAAKLGQEFGTRICLNVNDAATVVGRLVSGNG